MSIAVAAAALVLLAVVLYYVVPFRVDDEPGGELPEEFFRSDRFREPDWEWPR
jgi:hypothetical protein